VGLRAPVLEGRQQGGETVGLEAAQLEGLLTAVIHEGDDLLNEGVLGIFSLGGLQMVRLAKCKIFVDPNPDFVVLGETDHLWSDFVVDSIAGFQGQVALETVFEQSGSLMGL
jgi:hypothetical protein